MHIFLIRRMAAWITLLIIALAVGLPLDQVTIFWVGVMSLFVLRGGSDG
jgi:hypothetical protein